jgi:tryptophan-rich sensory protein
MSQKSGKKKFYTLFIQVHLLAIIWASIITAISNLLAGLISYLILVHLLASIAYITGLESLDLHELNSKLFKSQ